MAGEAQAGEVHWLTRQGSDNKPLYSGLWRCEPMTFRYEFPGDETVHGLEGELHIDFEDGEAVDFVQRRHRLVQERRPINLDSETILYEVFVITA